MVGTNAYEIGGSKPSEIRRSHDHLTKRMRNDDVAFAWITDGRGWQKSLTNVLGRATTTTDLYNLHQVDTQLPDDVEPFFRTTDV